MIDEYEDTKGGTLHDVITLLPGEHVDVPHARWRGEVVGGWRGVEGADQRRLQLMEFTSLFKKIACCLFN